MNRITIRNIPFHNVTMKEAMTLAQNALETPHPSVVVTPNAEIAQLALEDEKVLGAILGADIVLPDGQGVIKASRILQTPLKEKVAGVEFGLHLMAHAAENNLPVYLLGGKPSIAESAAEKLKARFPTLPIVGTHDGYFVKSGNESDAVIAEINAAKPAILIVCLGAPTQELWVHENREKLQEIRLCACLGGSLDIYAGAAKRAPKLFIRLHLEWLWRLLKEPRRLPRMMRLPKYILGAKKEARERKRQQ